MSTPTIDPRIPPPPLLSIQGGEHVNQSSPQAARHLSRPDPSRFTRVITDGYVWLRLPVRPHISIAIGYECRAHDIKCSAGVSGPDWETWNCWDAVTYGMVLDRLVEAIGAIKWRYSINQDGTEEADFLIRSPSWWDRLLYKILNPRIVDRLVDLAAPKYQ
jgi:hypothetical protein